MALISIPQGMTVLELEDLLTGLTPEQVEKIKMDNPVLEQMIKEGEQRTVRIAAEVIARG